MWVPVVRPVAMSVSKSLLTVLAVLLVAGSGAAVTGVAQTDAGDASASVSDLEMDATLDNETVAVTVVDGGESVENASITVEGDEEVTVATDANGTATVDRSALSEDDESLEELEVEYESDHAEGELEYVVSDGSLTLVEEQYEYEVDDEEDDESDEDESDEDESDEDESDEDESDEDESEGDDEAEVDDEEEADEDEDEESEDDEEDEDDDADGDDEDETDS